MTTQTPGPEYTIPQSPFVETAPTSTIPPAKKTGRKVPLLVAVLAGSGLALASCVTGAAMGGGGSPKAAPAPAASTVTKTVQLPAPAASTVTVTKEVAPPPPPAPQNVIRDGGWTACDDFPAGTYKATAAPDSCYWAIYKPGANIGSFDGILENHNGGGNLRVTIRDKYGFESDRCGTWEKIG